MDKLTEDNKTPVIVACEQGNAALLKQLLDDGASITNVDKSSKTALHYCADNMETQCAEMLLEKDMSILDIKEEQGYTALTLAVIVGNITLTKLLIDKGANINTEDNEGHKLAHWTAVCGHLKVLDILIQHSADLSSPDSHHAYPLHYAAQLNNSNSGNNESRVSEKVLKRFLDCKVPLDIVDNAKRQPLLWAACAGNAESCRLLLKAGADVNSRDKDELTVVHCAASRGHSKCINVLRKHGADMNSVDKNKCSPLFYSITLGNLDCTRALINAKADVNHVDDRGRNPCHCAAIKGCLDTIKMLEKEKCNIWLQNKKGDYPVHEAAQKGHIDVVKYLLGQRNDKDAVNVQSKIGKTLLHIAAATNNLPLIKLLINQDCDKNVPMKHAGKEFTPYDLAVIKGYPEAADFLKQKGAIAFSNITNVKTKEFSSSTKSLKGDSVEPAKEQDSLAKQQDSLLQKDKTNNSKQSPLKPTEQGSINENEVDPVKSLDIISAEKKEVVKSENTGTGPIEGASPKRVKIPPANIKESPKQTKVPKESGSPKKSGSLKNSDSPKKSGNSNNSNSPKRSNSRALDKAVGIDKLSTAINTDVANEQLGQKSSLDSLQQMATGILTSAESLNPLTKDAVTQKSGPIEIDKATSASSLGQAQRKEKSKGQDIVEPKPLTTSNVEQIHQEATAELPKLKGPKARFNNTNAEDTGIKIDPAYSRQKAKGHKSSLDKVRTSVRNYDRKRNMSRSLQQLRHAQVHSGPMHDIIMFSKTMENYRRGVNGEEDTNSHNYENWDSYLNDQMQFLSHISIDDNKSPRKIQKMAKEFQRKKNSDLDKEIDKIAARTASLFDNVKSGASTSVESARSRNLRLHEEIKQAREERLRNTLDPLERELLERQQLEELIAAQQQEMNYKHKEPIKKWLREKDEGMRDKLFQAYRPYFPNDVFNKKSVCISGGRIKSAGRLKIEPNISPQHGIPSSSPVSHKSDGNFSVAQYRQKDDKVHVQMTPYGLRRVRNQDRPTYDRRARVYVFKHEFEIQEPNFPYDPEQILRVIRQLESEIRRKYPATYESCVCGATRLRRFNERGEKLQAIDSTMPAYG